MVPFSGPEIAAAKALASRIGTFRFLAATRLKGGAARLHVGLTVQEAIAIREAHALDPFAYGFICHDAWKARDDAASPVTAGDRYGFRTDELLLFLARGLEARLAALESA